MTERTYWISTTVLQHDNYETIKVEERTQVPFEDATLVSSKLADGQHAPALDIDLPCTLLESTTPGHFHLFIDKPMSWRRYKAILRALKNADVIEDGYYGASVRRRMTMLRLPHIKKGDGHLPSDTDYGTP